LRGLLPFLDHLERCGDRRLALLLPEEFGKWNSVFRRFRRWAKKGVWKRLFTELGENPGLEYLIIDSTIVRAHQHAAGARKGKARMRRSGVRAEV
jgi:putative transposase